MELTVIRYDHIANEDFSRAQTIGLRCSIALTRAERSGLVLRGEGGAGAESAWFRASSPKASAEVRRQLAAILEATQVAAKPSELRRLHERAEADKRKLYDERKAGVRRRTPEFAPKKRNGRKPRRAW